MSGFGSKSANTFNVAPPAFYVAGAGRGATGFTTRSDIGPARPAMPGGIYKLCYIMHLDVLRVS